MPDRPSPRLSTRPKPSTTLNFSALAGARARCPTDHPGATPPQLPLVARHQHRRPTTNSHFPTRITPPHTWSFQPAATLHAATITVSALAAFLLCRHAATRTGGVWGIAAGLLALTLWQSVDGLRQYAAGLWFTDGGEVAHGSFLNRGYYAAFLSGGLWLALGVAASHSTRARSSPLSLSTTILASLTALAAVAAISSSLSRAALLVNAVLLCAAIYLLPFRTRRVAAPTLAALVLAAAIAIPDLSTQLIGRFHQLIAQGGDPGRLLIWRDTLTLALNHPFGYGAGTFPWAFERSAPYFLRKSINSAHSDYLEWALEFGPLVALLILAVLVFAIGRLFLNARHPTDPQNRWIALGATAGATALALHAITDSVLHTPAIAILLACLLGLAFGLTTSTPSTRQRSGTALLSTGLCASTLILGGALKPLDLDSHFARARQHHLQGNLLAARLDYLAALRASPRTAPAWLALADLARTEGANDESLRLAQIAQSVEPFTYRVEWALAGHQLAAGQVEHGVETLRAVCQQLPDLRPGAYLLAWRAGAPLDLIESRLTAPDPYAVGEYLAFLIRSGNLNQLPGAYKRLVQHHRVQLSEDHLRYLADQAQFTPPEQTSGTFLRPTPNTL